MNRYQRIQEVIENWEYRQVFCWLVDITDEEVAGQPGYSLLAAPKHIRTMAHKICCCDRYRGEKKNQKAVRRLIKALSFYPEVLEAALTEAFACG